MQVSWQTLLGEEKEKPYFKDLLAFISAKREQGIKVYPSQSDVFSAFKYTPAERLKVVILGQDPYHGEGQAHGLSFSVLADTKIPPSLRNIYKELERDITNFSMPNHGNLSHWAEQGVLLMNTVMTVEEGKANSHKNIGWETFTDHVIRQINSHLTGVIFLLWGKPSQSKTGLIDTAKHHVLSAPHPSPLSAHRGFLGCGHFSATNEILSSQGQKPIDWTL